MVSWNVRLVLESDTAFMGNDWVEMLYIKTRQHQFAKIAPCLRICTKKTAHGNSDCFKYHQTKEMPRPRGSDEVIGKHQARASSLVRNILMLTCYHFLSKSLVCVL